MSSDMKRDTKEKDVDPVLDVATGSLDDVVDHAAERKIVRKMDLNLITVFGGLYLMSFLGMFGRS